MLILILVISIVVYGCRMKDEYDKETEEMDMVEKRIAKMTIEEKIGQLLIVGLEGRVVGEKELYQLNNNKVGGFVLFARNIEDQEQTLSLLRDLKTNNESDIPLFMAVDEEGGSVSRLSNIYGPLPDMRALGHLNNKEISYVYGSNLGKRLKGIGLNLNFAPVLDINSNASNPVIGKRSFGSTAEIVIEHGIELMEGIRSQGIIPTVKHFPGHGDTDVDSHYDLPVVYKDKDELMDLELRPFIRAIDEDVEMIMIAHILYNQLDTDKPSTMSSEIMQNLLREELGYNNIIISDDMTMGAIIKNFTLEQAALDFLIGGGDILLICHGEDNPTIVIEAIKESIEEGRLSLEDIDEKLFRILSLKEKYKLDDEEILQMNIDSIRDDTRDLSNEIDR